MLPPFRHWFLEAWCCPLLRVVPEILPQRYWHHVGTHDFFCHTLHIVLSIDGSDGIETFTLHIISFRVDWKNGRNNDYSDVFGSFMIFQDLHNGWSLPCFHQFTATTLAKSVQIQVAGGGGGASLSAMTWRFPSWIAMPEIPHGTQENSTDEHIWISKNINRG
jgi:hypothetical protein